MEAIDQLKPGDAVRVSDPDDYIYSVRAKVSGGRVGYVKHVFERSRACVVVFPKAGRKQEFSGQFQFGFLQRVIDPPAGAP